MTLKFNITLAKRRQLLEMMSELGISEDDIVENFIKASGKGGQKVNKSSSCVYLKHEPSGVEVKCQQARSQALNRFIARRELCEKIAEINQELESERQKKIEKIRRQKRKRTKRQKEKILADKKYQGEKKKLRGSQTSQDHN